MTGETRELPMFPLSTVLFPGAVIPLHIFEERYRALTRDCLAGDSRFGIVLIERGIETGGDDQRAGTGTLVKIVRAQELADGRWLMLAEGEAPVGIETWLGDAPYPRAMVRSMPASDGAADPSAVHRAEQSLRRTRGLLSENGASAPLPAEFVLDDDVERATWQLCAEAPVSTYDAQRLLCSTRRLDLLIELIEEVEQDLRRMMSGG